MKAGGLDRRLTALEVKAKPRVISTLVDLVMYVESDGDEDVELSPELHELVEKANKEPGA